MNNKAMPNINHTFAFLADMKDFQPTEASELLNNIYSDNYVDVTSPSAPKCNVYQPKQPTRRRHLSSAPRQQAATSNLEPPKWHCATWTTVQPS